MVMAGTAEARKSLIPLVSVNSLWWLVDLVDVVVQIYADASQSSIIALYLIGFGIDLALHCLKSSPGWSDGDGYDGYRDYADGDQSYGQDEMSWDQHITMDEGT